MIITITAFIAALCAIMAGSENENKSIEKEFEGLNEGCEIYFSNTGRWYRKTADGIVEIKAA